MTVAGAYPTPSGALRVHCARFIRATMEQILIIELVSIIKVIIESRRTIPGGPEQTL